MKLLAVVSARGGSKGIPHKNIKPLAGKPLLGWTIDAAKRARLIDRVVVSTDDAEIASVARELGADVPFLRPAELALDDTPGIAPVLHAMDQLPEYDWALLLQPTSPLRTAEDIDGIIRYCVDRDAPSAISVCEAGTHPFWMYRRDECERLQPLISDRPVIACRQELPPTYVVNGALYIARCDWLRQHRDFFGPGTLGYLMPQERSADIDTPLDWQLVEFLMEHRNVS